MKKGLGSLVLLMIMGGVASAQDLLVNNLNDGSEAGNLRTILQYACDTSGNDRIYFEENTLLKTVAIEVEEPLVIPSDCKGTVTIEGPTQVPVILDGSSLPEQAGDPGEYCLLDVYSAGHTIRNLTFVGNGAGSGVCLFASGNRLEQNRLENHGYGVVVSEAFREVRDVELIDNQVFSSSRDAFRIYGNSHRLSGNVIEESGERAIYLQGDRAEIAGNRVTATGDHAVLIFGDEAVFRENQVRKAGGYGLMVDGNDAAVADNEIRHSRDHGIRIHGDSAEVERNQLIEPGKRGAALEGNQHRFRGNEIEGSGEEGLTVIGHNAIVWDNVIQLGESQGMELAGDGHSVGENHLIHNRFSGAFLQGDAISLIDNLIQGNGGDGIWIQGDDLVLLRNRVEWNGGCGRDDSKKGKAKCLKMGPKWKGGVGVRITQGSAGAQVGGESFADDANLIRFNRNGGVVIAGNGQGHTITHNQISENFGADPPLDLGADGLTLNDLGDGDSGSNRLLNFMDHFQAFPLYPVSPDGPRYWGWGVASEGSRLELYSVADSDAGEGTNHGGGFNHLGDIDLPEKTFEILLDPSSGFDGERWVTGLSFDGDGNTSEYALNTGVGEDADLDGILDRFETGGEESSDPAVVDSDGDGLPDPLEDKNRNGRWDPEEGETAAYLVDSDDDGVSDWAETGGDGIYQEGIDTDPLGVDTDGDGLSDGDEDKNGNGIWDGYLLETSPRLVDSDGDLIPDSTDNCPSIANPGQEERYCR